MKSSIVFFVLMFTSYSDAFLDVPENVYFDINNYYDSQCEKGSTNSTELVIYCSNSDDTNGIPSCCFDIIKKFAPFDNPEFDKCYSLNVNNRTNFINYTCRSADIGSITTIQVLAVIGCLCMILFLGGLFILMCRICFIGAKQRMYEQI